MSNTTQTPGSLDKWFEGKGPEPFWLDPSDNIGVFPDEYPAPGVLHHLIFLVRTPVAVENGVRLPWSDLPVDIRTRANDLVDLVMHGVRGMTTHHTVLVESNRNVIEPHRHVLAGQQPQTLWAPGRIGNPEYALSPDQYAQTARLMAAIELRSQADTLFAGTDWSVLGQPR